MSDLLIRNLDLGTHQELKRRAGDAGMSVQAYVSDLLEAHVARPTLSEWLGGLDDLSRHPELSGADAVDRARQNSP